MLLQRYASELQHNLSEVKYHNNSFVNQWSLKELILATAPTIDSDYINIIYKNEHFATHTGKKNTTSLRLVWIYRGRRVKGNVLEYEACVCGEEEMRFL